MNNPQLFFLIIFFLGILFSSSSATSYDYSAYTECKLVPESPLYNGGIINDQERGIVHISDPTTFVLQNLIGRTVFSFSSWVKISGADSDVVTASFTLDNTTYNCIGNVIAKRDCWSFLKGGFVLDSPSNYVIIAFKNSGGTGISINVTSLSLQPFSYQEWQTNQEDMINKKRKRSVMIHVSNGNGERLQRANVTIKQISKDFLFGSAFAPYILDHPAYQDWFLERFNAAVIENELKWIQMEPQKGQINFTLPDKMVQFMRAKQITLRGHNIFWDNPNFIPLWVRNLTGYDLKDAVRSRLQSLMTRYKTEFVHWDVNNEWLHFDFYERELGPNATLEFFQRAHELDPSATLFLNDYSVVETCDDANSTVDAYISRVKELERGGVYADGIGLEGHFHIPNPPFIRATLDKLALLDLPIWLTEVDIFHTFDKESQGRHLETVLREVYSHPAVTGIMLWVPLHSNGHCYEMCLTDTNLNNLPAGNVVDKLILNEWQTGAVRGQTDEYGSFSFDGFLGDYKVIVNYEGRRVKSRFSLSQSYETRHFSIQI